MSQHDFDLANQAGAAFRADLNNALLAIVSQSAGTTEPTTTYAHQIWADTTANLLKMRNAANNAWITIGTLGSAYLGLASLSADQEWAGSQRGAVTTDNDGSFDLNGGNNFKCTPTAGFTLTFTNITAGQSGMILLVNGSNYVIAAHTNTKVGTTTLATISATGTYLLSYFSDGTNVYVVNSGALA